MFDWEALNRECTKMAGMSKLAHLTAGVLLGFGLITGTAHPDDTCALRGKVVSSVDGTPLRGAMVQVSGETAQSTMTSAEGHLYFLI